MKVALLVLFAIIAQAYSAPSNKFRVRYGDTARLGEYPYVVLIYSGRSICTASIVGSNKVLTAGHCVCGQQEMKDVITETITTDTGLDPRVMYKVASYSYSPKYEKECGLLRQGRSGVGVAGYDIAMITIQGSFKFSKTVSKTRLASARPKNGERVRIVGYGKDENQKTGTLKHGALNLKDCPSGFDGLDDAICYNADENVNRQATGSGDSGGPMVNRNDEIYGVTSGKITYSLGRGPQNQLGVHASVNGGNAAYVAQAMR